MYLTALLKGKVAIVSTNVPGVTAELTINRVEINHHSEDLEPSTMENDWWPRSREWDTYSVSFTNGYTEIYSSLDEIQLKGEAGHE